MKDLCGRWLLTAVSVAVCLLAAGSTRAQEPAAVNCNDIYEKFAAEWKGPDLEKLKRAVFAGKDYVAKCGGLEGRAETRDFVVGHLPGMEQTIKFKELAARFEAALDNKNWEAVMENGRVLIEMRHPATLDILIAEAAVGYTNASAEPPVDKYNDDTIRSAKIVIEKLNEGLTSQNYGVKQFRYKTANCSDGKTNTMSWMNYIIGSIMYKRQNQAKESFPYLLRAGQTGCELKDYPEIHRLLGAWYTADMLKINEARLQKIKAAGDQETDETRTRLALVNGYAERAIDAYARAYRSARERADIPKAYKESLYNRLGDLYASRHDGKLDGLESFIATVASKRLPDPATPVKPVVDPDPVPVTPKAATQPKKP